MPRKLRLEYAGACYHVINRGNYRRDLFVGEGASASFEGCLFEAVGRFGWRLHAFVIMRNHFHLAVETPEPNLSAGMRWLQATWAARFNRWRGRNGATVSRALVSAASLVVGGRRGRFGAEAAVEGGVDFFELGFGDAREGVSAPVDWTQDKG